MPKYNGAHLKQDCKMRNESWGERAEGRDDLNDWRKDLKNLSGGPLSCIDIYARVWRM